MSKLRVYQFAREYTVPTSIFLKILNDSGVSAKNKGSFLSDEQIRNFRGKYTKDQVKDLAEEYRRKRQQQQNERQGQQRQQEGQNTGSAQKREANSQEASGQEQKAQDGEKREGSQNKKRRGNRKGRNRNKQGVQEAQRTQASPEQTEGEKREEKADHQKKQGRGQRNHQEQREGQQAEGRQGQKRGRGQRQGEGQQRSNRERQNDNHSRSSHQGEGRRQQQAEGRNDQGRQRGSRNGQRGQNESRQQNRHDQQRQQAQGRGREGQRPRNNRPGANMHQQMVSEPMPSSGGKPGKKRNKKNVYKEKKAERPIKIRDNRKRTKSKHTEYRKQVKEQRAEQFESSVVYEIPEVLTLAQLGDIIGVRPERIIQAILPIGLMVSVNEEIDAETAQIVAEEMGFEVEPMSSDDVVQKIFDDYDNLVTGNERKRPPVVTVMGHVDHGKTSLLDKIRKTNVTAGEAGGITQHIGAYTVRANNETITFIDTPGHAAFTAMRSRGAQMTDIAVLVVAADDGVMPQTIEAINHAKAAEVPIIVAINKIDKEGSNPERVKQELIDQGVIIEEWGGDVIAVPISAKEGTNIQDLLENILLVAEMEELKADPDRNARGSVIEAEVKKGKGSTASLLIKQGTLKVGDTILSGTTFGKIRTMIDDKGKRIRKAGPSMPVEVSGLQGLPEAGEDFIVLDDEKQARQLAQQRAELQKRMERAKTKHITLDNIYDFIKEGKVTDVNIIVKADVQGSVEALTQSLERLTNDEIRINILHSAVGAINETDVNLASTSGAVIIGFNVRSDKIAKEVAERDHVDVRYYSVIYDVINDVKKAMEGMLEPEFVEKQLGEAEVRETFRIPGGTIVAGSYVTDGKVARNNKARLLRDGVVIYESKIDSLRRFKDDVREVNQGYECGIIIENMNDVQVGDVIEVFEIEAVKRELETATA